MLELGAVGFLNPWLLAALAALPVIWWLIRALPPRPRTVRFPAIRLLFGLEAGDPPPDDTPLWVLILRLTIAALVIIALARPVIAPEGVSEGSGPVLIVLDDGWEAAANWPDRLDEIENIIALAERNEVSVTLLTTAPGIGSEVGELTPPQPQAPAAMLQEFRSLAPRPFSPDPAFAAQRLAALEQNNYHTFWLSDGIAHPESAELEAAIASISSQVTVIEPDGARMPVAMMEPVLAGLDIDVEIRRMAQNLPETRIVQAQAGDGRPLAEVELTFAPGNETAVARIELPHRMRNEVRQLRVVGARSAGSVYLFDARAGRPPVGILTTNNEQGVPPLTSARHFLHRGLEPFTSIDEGGVLALLEGDVSVILAPNLSVLDSASARRLERWVDEGGVLVRFAGPAMEDGADRLLPVQIRLGNRSLGGAFTWDEPKRLRPFPADSPFFGLPTPEEIVVNRQLLAAPTFDLAQKTWAVLEDGTPIVTGARKGNGWLILFHTSANGDWSNLALSGLFVRMLQRILPFAQIRGDLPQGNRDGLLNAARLLDGFGELQDGSGRVPAIRRDAISATPVTPATPAGYYGPSSQPFAINLANVNGPVGPDFSLQPLATNLPGREYGAAVASILDLKPTLLSAAMLLVLIDILAALWLRGLLSGIRIGRLGQGAVGLVLLFLVAPASDAQTTDDSFLIEAIRETRLAYVPTGNPGMDRIVEDGLKGLQYMMRQRTSVQLGAPMAVDPEQDIFIAFPLIYWPVTDDMPAPSERVTLNLQRYLGAGGMILFDTGIDDVNDIVPPMTNPTAEAALLRLLAGVNVPPLSPVNQDHVLSKSYYLLDSFPGRITGAELWAEAESSGSQAQVSGILIGAGDWASAWAVDELGTPIVNIAGGAYQREIALRFGINLIMYALTGTYKNDQVHLPVLMRRLGQ